MIDDTYQLSIIKTSLHHKLSVYVKYYNYVYLV